ncbi:Ig-like domain-containing protein, partial [Rubripirellula amarantea]|nr:Ig-like domain-containing protein [Rubripirellula amarantea]
AGTVMVPGFNGIDPTNLTNVNGTLFFSGREGSTGTEVWKTDGTAAGTMLVHDINPGFANSDPSGLVAVGNTLYFRANDGTNGSELWSTDGTSVGTTMVTDIRTGSPGSYPIELANVDGTLFFNAFNGTDGRELWKSDGTAVGTTLVSDIQLGTPSSNPINLTNVAGTVYFSANDGTGGNELWKSDGTAAGTTMVSDIQSGSLGSSPTDLINVEGTLFFNANDGTHGTELWASDGTQSGTQLVADLMPGPASSDSSYFTHLGDKLYFRATDVDFGDGLWRTDLATLATERLSNTANDSPQIKQLAKLNNNLIVVGISNEYNEELYRVSETYTPVALDAIDDLGFTTENTPTVIEVLNNDTPPSQIVVAGHSDGSNGNVADNGDGTLTYTPDAGFTGTDTFDYTIALQSAELISGDASSGDRFGYSVDIDGDFAVVGAYLDDPSGITNAGSAFLYQRITATQWSLVKQLNGDLDPSDAQSNFGFSVAIDGDSVVIGAQRDNGIGFQAGAAYVFDRNEGGLYQWGRIAKIVGNDTAKRDLFGRSVDISGDTIVVGASVADPVGASSGAAYVFDRDSGGTDHWGEVKKLTGSTQGAGDRFGQSVAIDADMIAIGAFRHDGTGSDSGAVYVFDRDQGGVDNWGELKAITASDAAAHDQFGYSVSVDAGSVAVGAPLDDEAGVNQLGAVYVLSQDAGGVNNWGQVVKFTADDSQAGDRFGTSVALSGNRIVAGSPQADHGGNQSGRAYSFESIGGTWNQTQVLTNSEVNAADQYGVAIAVDGDVALIGSWLDNRPANNSGGAYAFDLQIDTATVTITVASVASGLPLTQSLPEIKNISSESAGPIDVIKGERVKVAFNVEQASSHDRVFTAGLDDSSGVDEELESYLDDIAAGQWAAFSSAQTGALLTDS